MIGRWQDGIAMTARIGPDWNPAKPPLQPDAIGVFKEETLSPADNDFSFAGDDPRGLGCPLGAHIRRANSRDSLIPDDPEGLAVSNRHRILRRGRPYRRGEGDGEKQGLIFMALCSDIERQFEFMACAG